MVCQYCNKRLGFIQRLKGLSYCSIEHQELHFSLSFDRLRGSLSESPPDRAKLETLEARPEPTAALEQPPADALWPAARPEDEQNTHSEQLEQPEAELTVEPEASTVAQEASPTLEIASLVGAVGTNTGIDLPEAPFLPELPFRQDQRAALKNYLAKPVATPVQLPVSPTPKFPLQAASSLVLEVSPEEPAVAAALSTQTAWRPVAEGYPPVIVSDSATLLLDAAGAKLIQLRVGEPCRGKGPVPLPQPVAIATPLAQPRLPSRQAVHFLSPVFERPPEAVSFRSSWEGRPGSGPKLPPITGILRPQRDVVRLIPPALHRNVNGLPSFTFFAGEPHLPVPPDDPRIAAGSPFEALVTPRRAMRATNEALTLQRFALTAASSPLAVGSTIPLDSEPSSSSLLAAWVSPAAGNLIPPSVTGTAPGPTGLRWATQTVPLARSIAAALPPAAETALAVTNVVPFLILSKPSKMANRAMPSWSSTQPLSREACRLPAPISEQEWIQRAAYLQPSLPSPMSLVTWSRSLSISIPARNPSNLGGPAPIGLSANPGRVPALGLWSPSRRGQSLTPLLPKPKGVAWTPDTPMHATLRPLVIQPIRPGSEGTAPPSLVTVRVQPASMPVRPPAAAASGIEPVPGLAIAGSCPDSALTLTCTNMAHSASRLVWDFRVESHAVLPSFLTVSHAWAIGLAPVGHQVCWSAAPSAQAVRPVHPFAALNRVASSLTARLPGPAG